MHEESMPFTNASTYGKSLANPHEVLPPEKCNIANILKRQ